MCGKLMYLTFFALVLGLVSMVPAQDTADVLIRYPSISIPVLDGFVDDVWSFSTEQPIDVHINANPPSGAADCSGTWRALWDWEYLYVLVEVKDEMLLHDSTYNRSWEDDSVEIYVDGDNSKRISVDENDHQYCFRWYNQVETPRAHYHGESSLEGVEYAVDTNSNGYLFEIKLPWISIMGEQPTAGQLIGIDVFINDDDDGGSRDTQISYYATDWTGWNTPSMWGTGLLVADETSAADDSSLVIYYSFDDVSGIIADQSDKGHDGVVNGDVTAETDGKFNGAANFASGSYLDLDGPRFSAEDIPTSAITLAAWVKCENTGGHHAIFNARASDATWLIHPELRSNRQFRWLLRSYGNNTIFDISAGSVTWDEWLHYASTYDKAAGKAILYINGELVREENIINPQDIAGDWDRGARVGYNIDNARPFTGLMDDFCLFKRALSQAEVQGVMEEGVIVPSKNVYYVDTDAPGNNDGSSWANAYWCLQDALANARAGDEIRVAQGIHKPDQQVVRTGGLGSQVRNSGDRTASFELKRSVTIKGGYAGFGKPEPDARDIGLYKTILSGDLNGDDRLNFTNNSENSYHVVIGSRTNPTDVLDGFIVTGGNANGPPGFNNGGGIFIDDTGNLKILNCTFTGNSADEHGGGIYCAKSSPTIENCTIIGNLAYYYGGGILCETSLRISNCVIAGNSAMYGGAIYCFDSSTTIANCTIVGNYTSEYGGGGIYCGNSSPTVVNTILWNDIPDEIYLKYSSINVAYSNIQGGWPGTGNIDTNPLFVDAAGDDNFFGTEDDNLRLLPDSPCIDAGDNSAIPAGLTVDIDGNPRIASGTVDMGAYEGGMVLTTGIYYVDMDAPGNNDGSSWANAFRRLQDAFSAARYGDEIRVANGIYRPDQGLGQTSGNREATFRLENGLSIKGGYAGFGEADPNARDFETYNTILSGDLNGDDGPHFANNSENSYLVVVCIECNKSVMLDGFTITGGNATTDYIAGGMLNYESNPIVKNCTFNGNSAGQGGGMANRHSNPTVTNCTFSGNATVYGGGGMYNTDSSNPVVTDCIFIENSASMLGGGGMYNGDSSPTVTNCRFSGNYAMFGGGMYNVGGSSTTVTNCTFSENRVSAWGGGMQNEAGAKPTVTNCILWGDMPDEIAFSGSATVTYSNVEGGWAGIGNIASDPKFADAEGRLSFESPCIDAGNNDTVPSDITTDLDGNPRIVNSTVDMGAYERGPRLWASNPSPADGAITGQRTPVLRWTPGDTTVKYDVYFGAALDVVEDADISDQSGIYRGRCIDPSYITEQLELDGTYYWRIDEVEADGEIIHKGDVWSFTIVDQITVEYQVSSSEDDAYATNNNLQSVDAEYLKVGSSTFANPPYYMSGMVFRNVTVPRDTRILSAHLKIRSYNSHLTGSVYGIIKAEATDDTAAFDNYHHVDSLSTTVNSVIWDHDEPWLEDTWYDSPELTDVIQEVINREGWSAGNSLAILYSTRSEGDYRNFSSFDRGSGFAPELEITYAPK